ncbi:MAG: LamG domain-containing protein [bacterium]
MKRGLSIINFKNGFSLAEAIIASGILMIVVASVAASYFSVSRYVLAAGAEAQATFFAQEGLEAARNIRDKDFALLVAGTVNGLSNAGNVWNFSGTQDVKGIYTRKISIAAIDANTKEVSVQIDWLYKGVAKTLTLKREFTNWRKTKTVANNPVSRWPFDEDTGCSAMDSFGSNHGTLKPATCPIGSPAWINGTSQKVGISALNFNSAATFNYVEVPDANSLDLSTAGTIMAWIYPTSSGTTMGIVHKGAATNRSDEAYYLRMEDNRKILAGGRTAISDLLEIESNSLITLNAWSLVAFTWDSTGMKIYINGALSSQANNTVFSAKNSAGSLQMGALYSGASSNRFRGRIDEVSIYNTALSLSEISTIYNAQK